MPNLFQYAPELDPDFPKEVKLWTCPITGLQVPKDPAKNLQWRAALLQAAEDNESLQSVLLAACRDSLLFYINAFGWTLRVFRVDDDGNRQQVNEKVPLVTWPIQDRHLLTLEKCINEGTSLLTDKSRDMGASWNHIAVYSHRFNFKKNESHLLLSRKEEYVDGLDAIPKGYPYGSIAEPRTLFGKFDMMQSMLPEWMQPNKMTRKLMTVINHDTGTRLKGESSNASAGSADRTTSIMLDEMAKMRDGEAIQRSTADVTACRFPCSTPNGAGTAYSKWRMSGQIPVFILPWWEHPEKGRNRSVVQDSLGRFSITSPWYEKEKAKRTPKELAIEVDMDHVGSGDLFFEPEIIEGHRKKYAKKPFRVLKIDFEPKIPESEIPKALIRRKLDSVRVLPGNEAEGLRIWTNLVKRRPDQSRTYVIGVDISKGQGASNSSISIACNETREKIAAWVDANTPPHELARIVCAIALWTGGRGGLPLVIWENNGDPGLDFGRQLVKTYEYPNVYYARQTGTVSEKRGKRYGWRSSTEAKAIALGQLRAAYAKDAFINHDDQSLTECLMYVYYENGGVGPSELQMESASARKVHGDRVISDMLCVVGMEEGGRLTRQPRKIPPNTPAWRLREHERRLAAEKSGQLTRFDFTKEPV